MSDAVDHAFAELGKTPIAGGDPCGESVRYESEFEQLEAELAKQESLTAESVDWRIVTQLSSEILKNKSKDLLVASYLTRGLLENEGYLGLATGLQIMRDMVDGYWDGLFPPAKRMRARSSAVDWLAEKAGVHVSAHAPKAKENKAVIQAANLIKELNGLLAAKMGDMAPEVDGLSSPLKKMKRAAEHELSKENVVADKQEVSESSTPEVTTPAQVPVETPAAQSRPKAKQKATPSATVAEVESDNDTRKAMRQIQDMCRKTTSFWLKQKASDSRVYRLNRMAAWLMIDQLPPATDGTTQINPPPADRIKQLGEQLEQSQFSTLLPELEQTVSRAPYWFDGQRMVATALQGLGDEYKNARDTVLRELRNFLARVPQIVDLKFSDGTPFVDDQTRLWLDTEVVLEQVGGGVATGKSSSDVDKKPWTDALIKARKNASSGKINEVVQVFHDGISGSGSMRDRFHWKLSLAELLIQTGNTIVGTHLAESLAEQIEYFRLDEWEPDLSARIYQVFYEGCKKLQGKNQKDEVLSEKLDSAYAHLCRFDPVTALTFKETK